MRRHYRSCDDVCPRVAARRAAGEHPTALGRESSALSKFEEIRACHDCDRHSHRRDANIVSKRVAETICGTDAVRVFAEEQVSLMHGAGEHDQEARWIFFRDVPSSTEFDLLSATLPLVAKYKSVINFEIDVSTPAWWVGHLRKSSSNR